MKTTANIDEYSEKVTQLEKKKKKRKGYVLRH